MKTHLFFFHVVLLFALAIAVASGIVAPNAWAASVAASMLPGDTPLVVIRFNQPRVYFEQPLFTAVSRAVQVKSDVAFSLVSFVPATGEPERDQKLSQQAETNVSRVADAILQMGIPHTNVSVSREAAHGLKHDEVHIFVH